MRRTLSTLVVTGALLVVPVSAAYASPATTTNASCSNGTGGNGGGYNGAGNGSRAELSTTFHHRCGPQAPVYSGDSGDFN